MKLTKILLFSASLILSFIVFLTVFLGFSKGTFLSATEAEKKWGHVEFDADLAT